MGTDNINPSHYKDGWSNGAEVIDIAENLNFNRGNAVKYIARAGAKNPDTLVEDLRKAKWYIDRELSRLQRLAEIAAEAELEDWSGAEEDYFPEDGLVVPGVDGEWTEIGYVDMDRLFGFESVQDQINDYLTDWFGCNLRGAYPIKFDLRTIDPESYKILFNQTARDFKNEHAEKVGNGGMDDGSEEMT